MPAHKQKYHHDFKKKNPNKKGGRAEPGSVERLQYFESLINEYNLTKIREYKLQICGNLGNFSHDPRNSTQLLSLEVPALFLNTIRDCLHDGNRKLLTLAVAGICNLICASQQLRVQLFHQTEYHPNLVQCLSSSDPEVVVNCLTAFIYLCTPSVQVPGAELTPDKLCDFQASICADFEPLTNRVKLMLTETRPPPIDPRINLLAKIFLSDCCGLSV